MVLQESLLPLESVEQRPWCRGNVCVALGIAILAGSLYGVTLISRRATERVGGRSVNPCTVNVWIVRHGEKGNVSKGLSACGRKRAEHLAKIFGTSSSPSHLFATNPYVGPHIFREVETLEPLAHILRLPIDSRFCSGDEAHFSAWLLRQLPKWCGTLALISWEHCHIPRLLQGLGCYNASVSGQIPCRCCWPDNNYDSIIQLQYKVGPDDSYALHAISKTEGFPHICPDDNVVPSQDQYECAEVARAKGKTLQAAFGCTPNA